MANILRIQDFQHRISFATQEEEFNAFFSRFLQSDLGKIYISIPRKEMDASFGLKESRRGPRSLFSAQGKLALMFLKNYSGLSDLLVRLP